MQLGSNSMGKKRENLARALDEDNYVLMLSLDLSGAFDKVSIPLLIKRFKIISLTSDVNELVSLENMISGTHIRNWHLNCQSDSDSQSGILRCT
jgi:hypothetical protein